MSSLARVVPDRLARDVSDAVANAPGHEPVAVALALIRSVEERRDREAAFLLLAADAMITAACEDASAADDPGRTLGALVDEVAEDLG